MGFVEAVRTCFRKYFTFRGRASRPEYWWFVLFLFLGGIVASILDGIFFGTGQVMQEMTDTSVSFNAETNSGPVAALFGLVTLVPSLSAGWRRMHDTGRSGLYLLYPLIVMLGIAMFVAVMGSFDAGAGSVILIIAMIVLLISPLLVLWWLTRPSEPGPNQYGPNPHEVTQ